MMIMAATNGRRDGLPVAVLLGSLSLGGGGGGDEAASNKNDPLEDSPEAVLPLFWAAHVDEGEEALEVGFGGCDVTHPALMESKEKPI